jgi:[protein-PII] uridylyltransferase
MDIPYFEGPLSFFNQSRFRKSLESAEGRHIPVFKDAINAANVQLDRRFEEGEEIRNLIYDRALFIDCILHYCWHQFSWGDSVCLMAVGGYGRGELHPRSDIDLLLLLSEEKPEDMESAQGLVTLLWDIGLDIGSSVRTIEQCLEIAAEDITVMTNLIESRTLVGNGDLCLQLQKGVQPEHMWDSKAFFQAKWQEQVERHKKHSNTETNLEPNVKNAPGGLRDIQTIAWVAKRHFNVRTLKQLEGHNFFTEEEFALLQNGEEFLWRVRYGLHKVAGRAEERLLFDHQRALAAELGFEDKDGQLAVEQLMHRYYRVVLSLSELNDVLLHYLDESILNDGLDDVVRPINPRFRLRNGYIEVSSETVFLEEPSALLEIFVLMGQSETIKGVRPETIRLLRQHRNLIHEDFRNDEKNKELFLQLLRSEHGLFKQLRRMKRYNILGRYLPEFKNIIGQMQHDLFHIYTVDAHTLLLIKNLRKFRYDEAEQVFPLAWEVHKRIDKPELLYIAGLYHDIAKGRGGDHSTLGAVDAMDFCQRHGLSKSDSRLVVWLVEKHLLMSQVSQKQDLSDPEVIHQFASEVGDQRHLNYLYLLTVADINATNPTLWTNWRDTLMRQLYTETKRALRRGLENPIDRKELIEETQQAAMRKMIINGADEDKVLRLWDYLGDDYFLREGVDDIVWQSEAILEHNSPEDMVLTRHKENDHQAGITEIFLRTKNRDNVFAAVASALDNLNLSIIDARIYNTERGGYTIDTFYVAQEDGQPVELCEETTRKIHSALAEELALTDCYSDIVKRRTPRVLKHFAVPTRTSISNDINTNTTVLEVISPDRPGFLALIGRIFLEYGIQLQNAKITTLGERVEDIFFLTDKEGNPLSDPQLCEDMQRDICNQLDQQVQEE